MQQLNILIAGAGVAGFTCAGLLRQRGLQPDIIEKEPSEKFNKTGYMLGLLPVGGRVLTELDLKKNYFDRSIEMKHYEIHKEDGTLNKSYALDFINEDYGSYRGIEREKLIDVLLQKTGTDGIRFGTTISHIHQTDDQAEVEFSDGTRSSYDLIIVADGLYSPTRSLLWNDDEYAYEDMHWGGWVAWLEHQKTDTYKEYWGASSFMGLYPVKGRTGIFLGGPVDDIKSKGLRQFVADIKGWVIPEQKILHEALDVLVTTDNPYFWHFRDCRTKAWVKDRVVLLGDAACGFLPTAGVGASMAMDSASALADELSRTDKAHPSYGLKLYTKRQQERVEKAQDDSRNLGKMMFVKSKVLAGLRDYALRFYTLKQLTKNISRTLEG